MSAQNDRRSVTLHQQDGSMTVQEFADRHGISHKQAIYAIQHGKVIGARKDSRSKRWRVYPPALLATTPRKTRSVEPAAPAVELKPESQTARAARSSRAGDMAASGHAVAHPTEAAFRASGPLNADQQAPQGRAVPPVNVYRRPETQCACRGLVAAAKRQRAQGIRYMRLAVADCWQMYFALREYRDRLKRAIGKGKAEYAELRATDNLWNQLKRDLATSTGAFWL